MLMVNPIEGIARDNDIYLIQRVQSAERLPLTLDFGGPFGTEAVKPPRPKVAAGVTVPVAGMLTVNPTEGITGDSDIYLMQGLRGN